MSKGISKQDMKYLDNQRHLAEREGHLKNLRDIIDRAYKYYDGRTAMVEKVNGEVVSYTINRLKGDIDALGTALLAKGFKGKHIAILGENSYEWVVAFFAVTCGVGVVAPLDKELPDENLSMLMNKADCEAVFCSRTYFRTIKKHFDKNSDFKGAFTLYKSCDDDRFTSFDEMVSLGRELISKGDRSYLDAELDVDALAAIFFTSGTTGANKGVMLSHKNFATNVDGIISTIPTEYSAFSLLPMNHAYELSCDIFTSLYMNAVIYINDSLKNILPNIQLFKPEAMGAVPLVLEGIYNGIWATVEKKGLTEQVTKLVALSNKLREHGIDMRKVFFGSIQKTFCDRKFPTLCCGGAPSRADYIKGLGDFGFAVYNGYGLTEASPTITLNIHADENPLSAGYAFPKTKFIIHEPDEDGIGEIWVKGDNITKGYYKDEKATKASFTDGWFMTGDYGRVTPDGELFVSGRKKNLIILDNGENIFPEDLEFSIMDNIHYVREVVVMESEKEIVGKKQKIIAAAIYIEPADFPEKTAEELDAMTKAAVSALNKTLPAYKKVQDVVVVDKPFEKNSTRKVIRQKVIDMYNAVNV